MTRYAVGVVALLVACRADPVPPPSLPADALAGFRADPAQALSIADVARDAVDAAPLERLLRDAGFRGAVQRGFDRSAGPVRRVELRVSRFGTVEGARRYLGWLESHASDLIGDATSAGTQDTPPGTLVFVHVPGGCCPNEQAVALGAWASGRDVVRVLVAGPGADGTEAATLIGDLTAVIPADA